MGEGDEEAAVSLYEILQVSEDATMADIKKQRRRLALRFHPDKNMVCTSAVLVVLPSLTAALSRET